METLPKELLSIIFKNSASLEIFFVSKYWLNWGKLNFDVQVFCNVNMLMGGWRTTKLLLTEQELPPLSLLKNITHLIDKRVVSIQSNAAHIDDINSNSLLNDILLLSPNLKSLILAWEVKRIDFKKMILDNIILEVPTNVNEIILNIKPIKITEMRKNNPHYSKHKYIIMPNYESIKLIRVLDIFGVKFGIQN